jgi:hypothetical protein
MNETTRLVVKGLPPYVNEERLKNIFTANGRKITDCKLIKKYLLLFSRKLLILLGQMVDPDVLVI